MTVKRKKILLSNFGLSGCSINIPLGTKFFPVENAEVIENELIPKVKEESINPIIDYKKIIFRPADGNWDIIPSYKINLNFWMPDTVANGGTPYYRGYQTGANGAGVYADVNFLYDDIFCNTNRFIFSFLRFVYYDTPVSSENKVLFFNDVYTQLGPDQKNDEGFVKPVDECPISFAIGDPVLKPDMVHEDYHLYWFKDLVDNAPNQEYTMYMAALFNNAANGTSTPVAASKTPDPYNVQLSDLDGDNGILYVKVVLKYDSNDKLYKYRFEPNTKQKPTTGGINLNPTGTDIPTFTFWQINI